MDESILEVILGAVAMWLFALYQHPLALFFGMGLFGLGVGYVKHVRARLALPPRDDPRWNASPTEQLVGRGCVHCTRRFVVQSDAIRCEECSAYVHGRKCAEEHRRHEHPSGGETPYR